MKNTAQITTEEINGALDKILNVSSIQDIQYFNAGLMEKIERLTENAAKLQMAAAILDGRDPREAAQIAREAMVPLAFHLGLLVGSELEAGDAFTTLMRGGGFDDDGPAPDAGDTEHGDE